MNKTNVAYKQFMYYLFIGLSVLDICLAFFCGYRLFSILILQKHAVSFAAIDNRLIAMRIVLYSAGAIICFVAYPFLTLKRQALRDKVEYDENGSLRKGSFSQLSRKDREAIERQKTLDRERVLPSTLVKAATHVGSLTPEEDLKKMIGLTKVKQEVEKMLARMEFEADARKNKDKHVNAHMSTGMNMLFTGNPGTGKTSVARIMAAFLYKYGYIKKNQSVEVDGNFFNGLTKGESSAKVSSLILAARGGVLFIDEAYALLTGGQEVIATIVKAMEDYRDDTVFIFAGYEREMAEFIESNSGLKSRFKYILHFSNYSNEELGEIFELMAHEAGFCVKDEAKQRAISILNIKRKDRFFSNARDARNIVDKAIDNHALNMKKGLIELNDKFYLLEIDIVG